MILDGKQLRFPASAALAGLAKLRGMKKKKHTPIPSQRDMETVIAAMKKVLGPDFLAMAAEHGVNIEEMACFTPLSAHIEEARGRMGLSVKAVAKQLKTTQTKIKAIEGSSLDDVDGTVLAGYAALVGQGEYLAAWANANAALAHRLGVPGVPAPQRDIVPDHAPGAAPLRLLGDDEVFADPEVAAVADDLVAAIENMSDEEFFAGLEAPASFGKKPRPVKGDGAVWRIKITLLGLTPAIWRRFTVPDSITLAKLHDIIQIVMGWTDSHLHAFEIRKQRYERSYPGSDFGSHGSEPHDERKVTLAALGLRARSKFHYEYDFGDGWQHELLLEKILPADAPAYVCEDGEFGCPPEDCGGPFNYPEVLDAVNDPTHPDHEHWKEWLGEFDPFDFPIKAINKALARIGGRKKR